jgi:hypothetical protein
MGRAVLGGINPWAAKTVFNRAVSAVFALLERFEVTSDESLHCPLTLGPTSRSHRVRSSRLSWSKPAVTRLVHSQHQVVASPNLSVVIVLLSRQTKTEQKWVKSKQKQQRVGIT